MSGVVIPTEYDSSVHEIACSLAKRAKDTRMHRSCSAGRTCPRSCPNSEAPSPLKCRFNLTATLKDTKSCSGKPVCRPCRSCLRDLREIRPTCPPCCPEANTSEESITSSLCQNCQRGRCRPATPVQSCSCCSCCLRNSSSIMTIPELSGSNSNICICCDHLYEMNSSSIHRKSKKGKKAKGKRRTSLKEDGLPVTGPQPASGLPPFSVCPCCRVCQPPAPPMDPYMGTQYCQPPPCNCGRASLCPSPNMNTQCCASPSPQYSPAAACPHCPPRCQNPPAPCPPSSPGACSPTCPSSMGQEKRLFRITCRLCGQADDFTPSDFLKQLSKAPSEASPKLCMCPEPSPAPATDAPCRRENQVSPQGGATDEVKQSPKSSPVDSSQSPGVGPSASPPNGEATKQTSPRFSLSLGEPSSQPSPQGGPQSSGPSQEPQTLLQSSCACHRCCGEKPPSVRVAPCQQTQQGMQQEIMQQQQMLLQQQQRQIQSLQQQRDKSPIQNEASRKSGSTASLTPEEWLERENYMIDHPIEQLPDGSKRFRVQFDLRIFRADEIKVRTCGCQLAVMAQQAEAETNKAAAREYRRVLQLPPEVDARNLDARLGPDGILTVTAALTDLGGMGQGMWSPCNQCCPPPCPPASYNLAPSFQQGYGTCPPFLPRQCSPCSPCNQSVYSPPSPCSPAPCSPCNPCGRCNRCCPTPCQHAAQRANSMSPGGQCCHCRHN